MSEALFRATYADVKTIKTRKVVQFVFEVAQEQANHALECLGGLPRSDIDTWVAIARLGTPEHKEVPKEPPKKWQEMKPSQQAGIRCHDTQFQRWIAKKIKAESVSETEVAEFVRNYCMVSSRSDLDSNAEARNIWNQLDWEFQMQTGRTAEPR